LWFFVYGQVDLIDEALLNEWQQQKTLLNYRFFYNAFKDTQEGIGRDI
jgi:hypothetical protein